MQNQVLYNNQMDAQTNTSANVLQKGTLKENRRAAKPKRIRTSFTSFQLKRLEEVFKQGHVIARTARYKLSLELNLQEKQIKIWFQNRRMKEKKENSRAANNDGTPALQTPVNRNNSTVHNHRSCNTILFNPQMLPPCQYDSTPYYANCAALLDQTAYQNNLLLQASSSSSSYSYNTNSPPMDQNMGYQNADLQMPSTSTYNSNSSPLMDPAIPYQYNDLPSNLSPAAVNPTTYRFDGIQSDVVAPHFITPSFKNEDYIQQYPSLTETNNYLSLVASTTYKEQNFSGDISYYEIEQILGNSY